MYERHFRLRTKPFAMSPDPAFLFASSEHAEALMMLEFALESQAPFCMLTGEIGSGKTTLLRHFLRRHDGEFTVGLVSNTHAGFRSIHPWAAAALGIATSGGSETTLYEALIDFIVREYGKGRRTLLVVDEAHNLSTSILEELRLLSNVNSEQDLALQIFMVGQPELRQKVEQPELEQFAQRVAVDFHLGTLSCGDAAAYIAHRLTVAGGKPDLFAPEAIAFIHARTGGIPRLINQLCDLALVYAFAEELPAVDLRILELVLVDRKRRGAIPLFGKRAAATAPDADAAVNCS